MMDVMTAWPTWPLIALLLIMMFVADELGFRISNSNRWDEPEPSRTVSSALKASIFGLVAFLLGFSFSITANRYDARRKLVLDEANALGTCYLRAGLLEPPIGKDIQATLKSYAQTRLEYYEESLDSAAFAKNTQQMGRLMNELWPSVAQSVEANPQKAHTVQIIPAANAVIDLHSTRAWAVNSHLPASVLLLLIVSVLVSSLLIGHSSGQSHRRHLGLWIAFNLLFAMVLYVVLDFDRPRRGLLQIDHSPLTELLITMEADPDPSTEKAD